MTIESKMCAGACVLNTYFINDIFLALTNQTPCFEFCFVLLPLVLFCFTNSGVAFIIVIIY